MKLGLTIAALGILAASAVMGADKVQSGLKPGESPSAFDIVDITGPDKPKQLCLV
jgi:hypothetical protein